MPASISAVINTKNAAETLAATLKSVKWVDEAVVVDMQSTDQTKQIAKKHRVKVYDFKQNVNYVEPARNFALSKASHDWILLLDADEIVTTELQEKIKSLIKLDSNVNCYFLPRKNIIFGKWVEKTGWWPDYQPRLFRKGKVTWKDEIHSQPQILGQVEYLPATESLAIEHHNYRSVSDYLSRLDRYTAIAADESESNSNIQATDVIAAFRQELMRRLFAEEGISEGMHGISLSFLQSMYQVVAQLKIWEKQGSPISNQTAADVIAELRKLNSDLNYWIADFEQQQSTGITSYWWRLKKRFKK